MLIATILLIQFVAFGGALFFGRLAARLRRLPLDPVGTFAWMVIVVVALVLPAHHGALFLVSVAIGIVLGGTQALSRSFFSLLIPAAARASTSASTTPPSGAPRGSARCCSGWSSR